MIPQSTSAFQSCPRRPTNGQPGRRVNALTLKAMLATPLTELRPVKYYFARVQAGQCACELRNPQGSCCPGNVRALAPAVAREATGLEPEDL